MMVRLGKKKGVKPTHLLPMAMSTYDIMPPPETTQKDLGEERIVNYTGAGEQAPPQHSYGLYPQISVFVLLVLMAAAYLCRLLIQASAQV
jgi:hypothetical protein